MKIVKIIAVLSLLVFSGSISLAGSENGELHKKLAEAEKLYKEADKRGFAWTTTGGVLEKARTALKEKQMEAAAKYIEQALTEAKASVAQADDSDKNWESYIPN